MFENIKYLYFVVKIYQKHNKTGIKEQLLCKDYRYLFLSKW